MTLKTKEQIDAVVRPRIRELPVEGAVLLIRELNAKELCDWLDWRDQYQKEKSGPSTGFVETIYLAAIVIVDEEGKSLYSVAEIECWSASMLKSLTQTLWAAAGFTPISDAEKNLGEPPPAAMRVVSP